MVTQFVSAIYPGLSRDRLEAYRPMNGTDLEMLTNYIHNIALSEALYTPLGSREVALRNSLYETLRRFYKDQTWFDRHGVLDPYQAQQVADAKRRILNFRRATTPGRIVAELNFGFWVALLSDDYDKRFWWPNNAQLLKSAFPHVPHQLRQRKSIYGRFNSLRALRNRVMHHEPIWNRPTLARDYQNIYEALGWMSPEMVTTAKLIDRFPEVLLTGQAIAEATIRSQFGAP